MITDINYIKSEAESLTYLSDKLAEEGLNQPSFPKKAHLYALAAKNAEEAICLQKVIKSIERIRRSEKWN